MLVLAGAGALAASASGCTAVGSAQHSTKLRNMAGKKSGLVATFLGGWPQNFPSQPPTYYVNLSKK
jgi:hypothetical protein